MGEIRADKKELNPCNKDGTNAEVNEEERTIHG
jgi:hypothetical protein